MMSDELLQTRYQARLLKLIELAERTRPYKNTEFHSTAEMYLERFTLCKRLFENVYDRDITRGFKHLQDLGFLEIITCAATHGYLPNMQVNPSAVRAQIITAANSYQRFFGRNPPGIWLPECGYYPE